jgi:lysozyme family protein
MTTAAAALSDVGFVTCWPFTLAQECPFPNDWGNPKNFSNDAHDPGGATMCGIIQREYDVYRKSKGLPVQDVRLISHDEGADIYYNSYWLPECPKLGIGLDLSFFDEAVNAGPSAATRILQRAIGIPSDGLWGPQTDAVVKATTDPLTVINAFTAQREAYYRALPGFRYFGTDWIRRSQEIGAASAKLVPGKMINLADS